MNLIGAMLIMLGCAAAGIMKAHWLGELDKTYSSLSEISSRASALDDVMNVARSSTAGDTSRFIETVIENFSILGEKSFCTIWSSAAESCLQSISQRSLSAVKVLGGSLGKYESAMQCAAIGRCSAQTKECTSA